MTRPRLQLVEPPEPLPMKRGFLHVIVAGVFLVLAMLAALQLAWEVFGG